MSLRNQPGAQAETGDHQVEMVFLQTSDWEKPLALTPPLPHPQAVLVLKKPYCNRGCRCQVRLHPSLTSGEPPISRQNRVVLGIP